MTYVDGFVLPVPKKNIAAYKKMALGMAKLCKKYGALQYVEAVADNLHPPGCARPFNKVIKSKPGETIVFAFIVYKSKASRNSIMKKIMTDPSMGPENWKDIPMPFDMNKISSGGFKTIVQR